MRTLLAVLVCVVGIGRAWAGSFEIQDGSITEAKPRYLVAFRPGTTAMTRARTFESAGLSVEQDVPEFNAAVAEPAGGGFSAFSAAAEGPRSDVEKSSRRAGSFDPRKLMENPDVAAVEEDFYANWLKIDAPATLAQVAIPSLGEVMGGLPRFAPPSLEPPAAVPIGAAAAPRPASPPPVWRDQGELPWGVQRVGASRVWRRDDPRTQGAGVRVAVIDTGIDCTHPDLACSLAEGFNAVSPGASPADDEGHGTHVSGTIAAKWDGRGVVGVAPLAHLIPVKVLDKNGNGWLSSIVLGIVWAARHHAQVANMSFGSPRGSVFMHLAVQYARAMGMTMVVAAGNEGPDDKSVSYPGAYPEVISVAASDSGDQVAYFSSRGPEVKFIAPGVDVKSTVPGGRYETMSGTSMATPHVAGLAALAVAHGARGPEAVAAALKAAAAPLCQKKAAAGARPEGPVRLCSLPSANEQGAGLIDAAEVVAAR